MDKRTIFIAASLLGVSLAMFFLMFAIIKNFWATKKKMVIYVLLTLLTFSLVSLFSYDGLIADPNILLLLFQFCFLGLGIAHVKAMKDYMDWDQKNSVWPELLFSFFIWLIGLIPFYLLYISFSGFVNYQFYMLGASLFFIIPMFYHKTFRAALGMPHPDIDSWYYPTHIDVPDPKPHELQNPFVITFIIQKKAEDEEPTTFRAKAPENMNLGGLFYFFVEDFNEQNVEAPLEFTDDFGQPYGWNFYFKPKWYWLFKKHYLNPAHTVKENDLEEDCVVVCERQDVLDEEDDDNINVLKGEVSSY
jgi:hypothetical protein